MGTDVSKTSLGTVAKPSDSQNLIEFVPYYAPTGVLTAGESMFLETAIESVSVNDILPKRVINPPIQAGLGATYATLIPIIDAFECNTKLAKGSSSVIEVFGQAQVSNTAAPVMGCELHFSDNPPTDAQVYYDKPDNETSTGTAATTVTGGTMTINGGTMLKTLFAEVAAGTVTASQAYIGSMQFNSPNFDNSQDLEIATQPVASSLSTLVGAMQPKASVRKNVMMGMKSNCVITTVYNQAEVLTAAGVFLGTIGYLK